MTIIATVRLIGLLVTKFIRVCLFTGFLYYQTSIDQFSAITLQPFTEALLFDKTITYSRNKIIIMAQPIHQPLSLLTAATSVYVGFMLS